MMMVAPPLGKITKKKLLNCIPEISELSDTQSTSHKAFFFFFNLPWIPPPPQSLIPNSHKKSHDLKIFSCKLCHSPHASFLYTSYAQESPACQNVNQPPKPKVITYVKSLLISVRKKLTIFLNFFYNFVSSLNNLIYITIRNGRKSN